jgi:hypothetical protein
MARQICAITKRPKSAPVVVTYAFMIWLPNNLRPTVPRDAFTCGNRGGGNEYSTRVRRESMISYATQVLAGRRLPVQRYATRSKLAHNDEVE